MKRLRKGVKFFLVVTVLLAYLLVVPGVIYYLLTGNGFTDVMMALDDFENNYE